ncbi:hypothetical protein E2C01_096287 [Portunus trituberculatus]|uniref:Uncharacterized protein n=1 Tax=Portunus trituberculatus TaxID=210409 RepID=A0A5B7K660_PORTR|nr:hypothetical protein [Portunus trituberculatus]
MRRQKCLCRWSPPLIRPSEGQKSRKLLWEALLEGNPPPYSDLKMTSRGPGQPPHENLIVFFYV